MINVCIAGATGWAGRALVGGVLEADDMVLRSAVARSAAGARFGEGFPIRRQWNIVHLKRNRLARPVAGFIDFLRSGTWGMPGVASDGGFPE